MVKEKGISLQKVIDMIIERLDLHTDNDTKIANILMMQEKRIKALEKKINNRGK